MCSHLAEVNELHISASAPAQCERNSSGQLANTEERNDSERLDATLGSVCLIAE